MTSVVVTGETSLYVDLLNGPAALEDLLLAGLATPEMHQVWQEKLDCNPGVLIVRNLGYQSHAICFLQTHSDFRHHCFDVKEPVRDGMHNVLTLNHDAETRIVRDDLSMNLSLELEPECLIDQREIDLP